MLSDPSATAPSSDAQELVAMAREAMRQAYAPYSRFAVGAAVRDERGRVFTGANVENASFGLSMCAERVAIFAAIADGARRITAIAVTAERERTVTPCGACRQVMAEFCDSATPVYSEGGADRVRAWTVGDLLPDAFGPSSLGAPSPEDSS